MAATAECVARVDPTSLRRTSAGSITGPIHLAYVDSHGAWAAFPNDSWDDFPVVVLEWWLRGLDELATASASSVECMFMDGPQRFVVHRSGEAMLSVQFIGHATAADATTGGVVTPAAYLWRSLLQAGHAVLSEVQSRGWESRDSDALSAALGRTGYSSALQ